VNNRNDVNQEITTENLSAPTIHITPAPIRRRIAAGIIDSVILLIAWSIQTGMFHQDYLSIVRSYLSWMSLALIVFAYYFLLEGLFSTTVGKHVFRIVVVDRLGDPCTFAMSFKRNLVRFVDWLPAVYVVGGVALLISKDRQRLGDLAAGSIVMRAKEKDTNPPSAPFLFH